ncbi:MAG: hypothetical protein Q7J30_02195 [Candidatus Azambacteria bacterium]|nr:hypothetical protein [Candidatus Azambacteria bacterium]
MKVKSFVVGIANGIDGSMMLLDESVAKLGKIKIHSVTDTVIPPGVVIRTGEKKASALIFRVIVYTLE